MRSATRHPCKSASSRATSGSPTNWSIYGWKAVAEATPAKATPFRGISPECTAIDCFQKRGKKGYLFTIGDEEPPEVLTRSELKKVLDAPVQRDFGSAELLDLATRQYEVFHVIVEQGNHCLRGGLPSVLKKWTALLGQRALRLNDYTKLPEVIVSAIQVNEGASPAAVADTWSGDTALVVRHAVAGLAPKEKPSPAEGNSTVVRF